MDHITDLLIFSPETGDRQGGRTYNTMKLAILIPLRTSLSILALARTELAKVLCCSGRGVGE